MAKIKSNLFKKQIITARIESIASGGQGFCKHEGCSVFVDRGVPGDLVELELYDVRRDFAHARITKVIEPSPMRQEAPCALFKVCGGCQWQHISYDNQLNLKTDIVRQVVKHIAGLDPDLVQPTLASDPQLNYRNKVQFPVGQPNNSNRILAGYFREGSHELVNIKHCPVQPEPLDALLEEAKLAAEAAGMDAYNERTHEGLLRHLIFRYSFSGDEALLTLVLNAHADEGELFDEALDIFIDEMTVNRSPLIGICINFNPSRGNRIMGDITECVWGEGNVIELLKSRRADAPPKLTQGLQFKLSPGSFFQVNTAQAVTLLDMVLESVIEFKNEKELEKVPLILDAYAGVGTIACWVSELAERVIAVEEVSDAIADAEEILELNQIENVELKEGSVESVFPQLVSNGMLADIVILDPPRKGVDKDALYTMAAFQPRRIIYVSCNPATLARDLKVLETLNYKTRAIRPLDLFPQTYHVESVTVLDLID